GAVGGGVGGGGGEGGGGRGGVAERQVEQREVAVGGPRRAAGQRERRHVDAVEVGDRELARVGGRDVEWAAVAAAHPDAGVGAGGQREPDRRVLGGAGRGVDRDRDSAPRRRR